MLVFSVIALFLVFWIARNGLRNAGHGDDLAYGVPSALVIAFVLGSVIHPFRPISIAAEIDRISPDAPRSAAPIRLQAAIDSGVRIETNVHAVGSVDEIAVVGKELRVRGWIVSPSRRIPSRVYIVVDGSKAFDVTNAYGKPRPDVASALQSSELIASGVDGVVAVEGLSRGSHSITLGERDERSIALDVLLADRRFDVP